MAKWVFPTPGGPEEDDVLRALHETEAGQFAEHLPVDRGLEVEVELLEGLQPGEARQLQPTLDPALVPASPFGFERLGEKPLVVDVALGRLLADAVELGQEVLHLHPLEEARQFHVPASSYTARGRRSTSRVRAQRAA